MPRFPHSFLVACALALLGGRVPTLSAQDAKPARSPHQRLPLSAHGLVKIFNLSGAVRVTGWDRDTVAVDGTVASTLRFFMGGSANGIKLGLEGDAATAGAGADLVVFVPAGARLWVRTSGADIEVQGVTGSVDIGSVEGRIRVQGSPAELTVESMGGVIDIESSPTYFRAKSASGRITWSGSSEDAALSTVGGAITVRAGVVTRARLESVTGDIRYAGGLVRGGALTLDSHSGDVSAVLSKYATAELEVDAPTSDVLGVRATQGVALARRSPVFHTLGKEGFPSARIVLRSFKGRATVTQP